MEKPSSWLPCDGCGLSASSAHIAERLKRLEVATRYRPTHIGVLFIATAPLVGQQDDFYGPPKSRSFFDPFLEAVGIFAAATTGAGGESIEAEIARLVEFQRKGYYLSYLSECPLPDEQDSVRSAINRLGPSLVLRIRFNYRPKKVAILGPELAPLRSLLDDAGMSSTILPLLEMPRPGDSSKIAQFRAVLSSVELGG